MRKITLFLIAAAFVASAANTASADHRFYVGLTDETFDGDSGMVAMHRACGAKFKGGVMCTTRMIIEGGFDSLAQLPQNGVEAWINPAPVGPTNDSFQTFTDFTGLDGSISSSNCAVWDSLNGSGFTIEGKLGRPEGAKIEMDLDTCADFNPVACCSDKSLTGRASP